MNKVILIGNVGSEVEVRAYNGGEIKKFSLATSENRKAKDGTWQELTEWHKVVCFGKTSEYLNVSKGDKVVVEGKIHYDSYEKEGEKKYFTEINADSVRTLTRKENGEAKSDGPKKFVHPSAEVEPVGQEEDDLNLPF